MKQHFWLIFRGVGGAALTQDFGLSRCRLNVDHASVLRFISISVAVGFDQRDEGDKVAGLWHFLNKAHEACFHRHIALNLNHPFALNSPFDGQ